MSLWDDIKRGKKPWKPKLSVKSVCLRFGFALPFLAFGFYLVYRTADIHIELERTDGSVSARTYRENLLLSFSKQEIPNVTGVWVESELRSVEKVSSGGSTSSIKSYMDRSVSRLVFVGEEEATYPVGEFRFDSDAVNSNLEQEIAQFLQSPDVKSFEGVVPYPKNFTPVVIALVFLLGLGGFITFSLLVDFLLYGIQSAARKKK